MLYHGPFFRWFAWRPVWTRDRGWRWLRTLWRSREYLTVESCMAEVIAGPGWLHYVERPERIY